MAKIRKRGNKYYIDYRIGGKRVRRVVGSLQEAQLELARVQAEITRQKTGQKQLPLRQFFNEIRAHFQRELAPSSQRRYQVIIENFLSFIAAKHPQLKTLAQVLPVIIEDYIKFRQDENKEERTIKAEMTVLRMVFRLGVEWGELAINPTDAVEPIEVIKERPPRYLSNDEVKMLFDQVDPWDYPIFYTFLATGIRKAELEGLRWQDIDFRNRTLHIHAHDRRTPESAIRTIPINDEFINVLENHRDQCLKERIPVRGEDHVFVDKKGNPLAPHRIRYLLLNLCKQCGILDVSHVDVLRHTFAHSFIQKGADLYTLKKVMGHATIQSTLFYSEWISASVEDVIKRMNIEEEEET